MKPKSRSRLDTKSWFFSKDIFLFDLDGTLYLGNRVLPGALELIEKLNAASKKIYFFTNNSSRSEVDYIEKLSKMGFPVEADQIIMSTHILIRYLKSKNINRIYLLGTPAMASMIEAAGIRIDESTPESIVVGFDKTLTYEKLKRACELIEKRIPYIVTHPDLYCPTDHGREPDCGTIARALELVTEASPKIVLGKPHPMMMREAVLRSKGSTRQIVLTGDRLSTDIEMARASKVESLLVLSGETTPSKLKQSRIKPTFVVRSVADLI